jgi:hypothetical protein
MCQDNLGHKKRAVIAMFVVGRELCLLRIETHMTASRHKKE